MLIEGAVILEEGRLWTKWTDDLDVLIVISSQSQNVCKLHPTAGVVFVQQVALKVVERSRSSIRNAEFTSWHRTFSMLRDVREVLDMEWENISGEMGSTSGLWAREQLVHIVSGAHVVNKLVFASESHATALG